MTFGASKWGFNIQLSAFGCGNWPYDCEKWTSKGENSDAKMHRCAYEVEISVKKTE